jgi:hypothetical protein
MYIHTRRRVLTTLASFAGATAGASVLAACGAPATPGISLKIERPVLAPRRTPSLPRRVTCHRW